jgi:hypothetical protein
MPVPLTTLLLGALVMAAGDDPFADAVLDYDPGLNPAPGYTDASTALASPERFTGEGVFPGVVSPFNSPFGADEIVSIGVDGWLVVSFDTPVTDDPANPFGIDLLIFGNSFFLDASYPSGIVGGGPVADGGIIEVSADCETFFVVPGVQADGLFPTLGWLDAGPYDAVPGRAPANFTWPVDPTLIAADFAGLAHDDVVAAYAGSGGGAGIDLASVGLASITCVRITNPGDPRFDPNVEIDAFSDVTPDAGPADIDGDGDVDTADFLLLLGAWGPCPPGLCAADVNDDGNVDTIDMLELLGSWTV